MRGMCDLPRPATNVTAFPSLSASSGVIASVFATPRTPSVPKRVRSAEAPFVPLDLGVFETDFTACTYSTAASGPRAAGARRALDPRDEDGAHPVRVLDGLCCEEAPGVRRERAPLVSPDDRRVR